MKRAWRAIAFGGALLALNGHLSSAASEMSTGSWVMIGLLGALLATMWVMRGRRGPQRYSKPWE